MDIPVLMTLFPWPLSFVAKKELLKAPIINLWILALDCVILDRQKPFDSFRRISERLQKKGKNPVIIFPEGTRSRGKNEGKWKQGGIKLIKEAGIPIVKVKIEGSYKIWEENARISPADVWVEIYPPTSDIY
jgi:1-acyl-sn-glycerol-3-phosphate acyltransferase